MSDVSAVVLNSVVDSLDVRVHRHVSPSPWLRSVLPVWQTWQADWEPADPDHYVQLPGLGTFRLLPSGRAPYTFVLVNPQIADIRIWNPGRWSGVNCSQTGQFYVNFRSVFMQYHGLEGARAFIDALVALFTQPQTHERADRFPEFDRIARADLAADTTGSAMTWASLETYRCRARKMDVFTTLLDDPVHNPKNMLSDRREDSYPQLDNKGGDSYMGERFRLPQLAHQPALRAAVAGLVSELSDELHAAATAASGASVSRIVTHGRRPQSVYFGRFGSPLYARRYNKRGSLVPQDKLYMLDVWTANCPEWDGKGDVWRTEFSLSGDFLKRLILSTGEVRDLRDLAAWDAGLLADLWAYLTGSWLEGCTPSADTNVSRWEHSPEWLVIRSAFAGGERVRRDHSRTIPREDRHLVVQAGGCMLTTVALRAVAAQDLDTAMTNVVDEVLNLFNAEDFAFKLETRAREMGLDEYSDTALSALFRREHIAQGVGS